MTEIDTKNSCFQCRHLFVTHDKNKRWGCRKFGFKSAILPARVVLSTSGMKCASFQNRSSGDKTTNVRSKGRFA
ncbi:MAG: uracil-DNA glycosylase [Candidatus Micropelagos sp.]|uniref:Uracil-DNA glycosylase n=1 Tax=PS1 clade bacterium TaxID=2175152 RepID=A0A368EKP4_9PROT|nr:MAG: uracil-DNA glycosylase [PS1 clade bacterium]HCN31654.1 uracil-DNA glycosylase [Rhodobiaceae bacterium]